MSVNTDLAVFTVESVYNSVYNTRCNNRVQCYNGGVDEMYCTEEDKVFRCYYSHSTSTTASQVCDGKCDCSDYCNDEWECGEYIYHYLYTCSNTGLTIPSLYVCDNHTRCPLGDDESNCEEETCVWEGYSTRTYKLANYSRCTPWVMCHNKLDHTNCTDTRLAPLQCPVGGYMSRVSQYIKYGIYMGKYYSQ